MMRRLFASYLFAQRAHKDGRAGLACYRYGVRARAS
jgi:hypothetical protein